MAKTQTTLAEAEDMAIHGGGKELILSAEEYRIVALILAGYTYQEMARQFSLAASTVSRRAGRILAKLGVANKLELVLFAIHYGIVFPQQP
jgi:DNA-binding CsgD family transcriptional regulator